jgi:hypothetical protein
MGYEMRAGSGMSGKAKGLHHMCVGCAVLSEIRITNNQDPKNVSGYRVLWTKSPNPHQGGIALMWEEKNPDFEVEAAKVVSPNIMTFQLITGDDQYFVMKAYIPPDDTMELDDLQAVWTTYLKSYKPIIMRDLNINFSFPHNDKWEDIIRDLLWQNQPCQSVSQIPSSTGSTTRKGESLVLAAVEGRTVASIPAKLHHGMGNRCQDVPWCKLLLTNDPSFGSLCSGCKVLRGKEEWIKLYQ